MDTDDKSIMCAGWPFAKIRVLQQTVATRTQTLLSLPVKQWPFFPWTICPAGRSRFPAAGVQGFFFHQTVRFQKKNWPKRKTASLWTTSNESRGSCRPSSNTEPLVVTPICSSESLVITVTVTQCATAAESLQCVGRRSLKSCFAETLLQHCVCVCVMRKRQCNKTQSVPRQWV